MTGLRLMNEIMDPATARRRSGRNVHLESRPAPSASAEPVAARSSTAAQQGPRRHSGSDSCRTSTAASRLVPQLAEVWSYINPFMLYGRHLGYKGNFEKQLLRTRGQGAGAAYTTIEAVKDEAAGVHEGPRGLAVLRGRARRQPIHLFEPEQREPVHTFLSAASRDATACASATTCSIR